MSESAQSVSSSAAIRHRLFGTSLKPTKQQPDSTSETIPSESQSSETLFSGGVEILDEKHNEHIYASPEEVGQNVWRKRWDAAPELWRQFVSTKSKVFGLTEEEEEKLKRKNKTYVPTPPLSGNGGLGTSLIIGTVGTFSKIVMKALNTVHEYRMELLFNFIEYRDKSQGLLTFSNHQSVLDDPILLAAILPNRILLNPQLMRWGLCSLDICFQNSLVGRTLRLGKAIPIQRRGGIAQPFLRTASGKLSNGDWVHIYPEGRTRQIGMGYAKRGVGKLLAMTYEARRGLPIVLPMYHEGVEQILPQSPETNNLKSAFPKLGKQMFIMTGEPLDLTHIFQRLMPDCIAAGGTATDPPPCIRLYEEVADAMGVTMRLLRAEMRRKVRLDHSIDLGEPYELS